jgi:cell division protein FtsA
MNKLGQVEVSAKATAQCGGMRKGQITDIESVAGSIMTTVKQVESAAGIRIGSAYINVMGLHVDMFTNRASAAVMNENREISKTDVQKLLKQVQSVAIPGDTWLIDRIPRQFVIDGIGGISEPVGMIGTNIELEADIVTGKVASITNISKCIESAGIKIDGFVVSGQALGEEILTPEEKEMGVILIDVGGSVTDVSVFKGGRLFFYKSLLVGGDHITSDISIGMKITYADAERIKRDNALALSTLIDRDQELYVTDLNDNTRKRVYTSEIIEVIEARVYEIFSMCRDLLNENQIEFDFGAGVALTGGGILYLNGNRQIANEVLGLPVKVYPARAYGNQSNQKVESTLAEGMIKHIDKMRKGERYGSIVQQQKGRQSGSEYGLLHRIAELLKRIF